MNRFLNIMLVSLMAMPGLSGQAQGKRLALIIGNSDYQYIQELKNPVNDAEDVAEEFERIGFDILDFYDLTKVEFRRAIIEFTQRVSQYEVVVIYYAGHGLEIKGSNYLIPTDAYAVSEKEAISNSISVNSLMKLLPQDGRATNIVILDACRNNPFSLMSESSGGLATMNAPPETIISFSTAPGKVALDGLGRNSPFTSGLLNYLFFYDLDIKEMFEKVRSDVMKETQGTQIPWESTSLTRKIVLRKKPELELVADILEGEQVQFHDLGRLHARSNLSNVTYGWFLEGKKLGTGKVLEVHNSGEYMLKATSFQGQTYITSIVVDIRSSVRPTAHIAEGERVVFEESGELHAKSNVFGEYYWTKESQFVGSGPILNVSESGNYNLTIITRDGSRYTSPSTKVIIK